MESLISQISSRTVVFLASIMPIVAAVAISINIFHVLILTRSSVTSSSMNTLLIGIAIVDILSPMLFIKWGIVRVVDLLNPDSECFSSSHTEVLFELILSSLSEYFRRCSTWLGLLLAVTRTISLKLAAKRSWDFITEPKFGVYLIIGTLLCSSLILSTYFLRYRIVENDAHYCSDSGVPILVQSFSLSELVSIDSRRLHILLTGIFGQLIPSILFPIFAGILICELKRPEKKASDASAKNAEKISKTVIYMTVTFLLIELPIGIGKMVNAMQTTSSIPHDFNQIFHYLYVPMTVVHCAICFSMSSQYQSTILRVMRVERKSQHTPSSLLINPSTMAVVSVNK